MAGVRIRWSGVARVAAVVVVGLIALRLLPGLLRAPEPPPLAADVGLPKAEPVKSEPVRAIMPAPTERRRRKPKPRREVPALADPKVRIAADEPASTARIGTGERRHRRPHRQAPAHHAKAVRVSRERVESTAATVPEYVPPAPPEPAPEVLPAPPPRTDSTPGDGSEEFAPH
jgi:hypothetical protein